MRRSPAPVALVREAVRRVIEGTPELTRDPLLRRRLAERMVGVSLSAANLIAEEARLTEEIAARASSMREKRQRPPDSSAGARLALAEGQAAGDIHKRTAVNSAAAVLRATRDAIDFPGFVTSLISGVFQAMTTSSIQQLQAYADLLEAVNVSTSEFATTQITSDRAVQWAVSKFPAFTVTREGDRQKLALRRDADMPEPEVLQKALDATDDEVSTIQDDELEQTLLPLVRRKLARDRQSMLATMVLMGMQRIVVDEGRIHASMNLQVDARSTAEQTTAERTDVRVTTSASGSFGMGVWGASASLSATVGYVKSDEQFSREDIAVKAALRSSVDLAFRTEPIVLERMANKVSIDRMKTKSLVPEAEASPENLLTADERKTSRPTFDAVPQPPAAPDPGSDEQRALRSKKNFGADGDAAAPGGAGETTAGGDHAASGDRTSAGADRAADSPGAGGAPPGGGGAAPTGDHQGTAATTNGSRAGGVSSRAGAGRSAGTGTARGRSVGAVTNTASPTSETAPGPN